MARPHLSGEATAQLDARLLHPLDVMGIRTLGLPVEDPLKGPQQRLQLLLRLGHAPLFIRRLLACQGPPALQQFARRTDLHVGRGHAVPSEAYLAPTATRARLVHSHSPPSLDDRTRSDVPCPISIVIGPVQAGRGFGPTLSQLVVSTRSAAQASA